MNANYFKKFQEAYLKAAPRRNFRIASSRSKRWSFGSGVQTGVDGEFHGERS